MSDITIPDEALEAAARALQQWLAYTLEKDTRASELTDEERAILARAACLAMLRAWPGMQRAGKIDTAIIILPLTQENTNAEA